MGKNVCLRKSCNIQALCLQHLKHYFHLFMNICYSAENGQKKFDSALPESSIKGPRIHNKEGKF